MTTFELRTDKPTKQVNKQTKKPTELGAIDKNIDTSNLDNLCGIPLVLSTRLVRKAWLHLFDDLK